MDATIAAVIAARFEYWMTTLLIAVGLYGMVVKGNLVKKMIGLNIVQSAIILLFISLSVKPGGTVPILMSGADGETAVYMSPLPHVLMLTAIVVMVGTAGVAYALLIRIYRSYGTLEEKRLLGRAP